MSLVKLCRYSRKKRVGDKQCRQGGSFKDGPRVPETILRDWQVTEEKKEERIKRKSKYEMI